MNADINNWLQLILRWAHVVAGIAWIGHLWFFNWVNGPFQGKIDGPTKKIVNPELMPRALFWFRWGAAWTWITGILLAGLIYYQSRQVLFETGNGKLAVMDPNGGHIHEVPGLPSRCTEDGASWSGADAWFVKPVDPFELADRVVELVAEREIA